MVADEGQVLRYTNACVKIMKENKIKVYCTFQDAPQHHFQDHPESPKRLQALRGWLESPPYPEIEWLNPSPAQEADVLLIHTHTLVQRIKSECQRGPHVFDSSPSYVTESSYQDALVAVGAALTVSRRIINEGSGHGFAILRPPGHHAEPGESMGFCLFNNVAIAAADAVASGLKRVAIVDFDAHHGNGIEASFWDTPQVGYFSTHERDLYPRTGQISSAPHARGRIVNVPLPDFAGNDAYNAVFTDLLDPWIAQFKPEMIFVAAGFDPHFSDPLTTLTLDTDGFFQITQHLVELARAFCGGKMMMVLEGGYDRVALKDNIQACLAAMNGHQTYEDHYGKGPAVNPDIGPLIANLQKIHHL